MTLLLEAFSRSELPLFERKPAARAVAGVLCLATQAGLYAQRAERRGMAALRCLQRVKLLNVQ